MFGSSWIKSWSPVTVVRYCVLCIGTSMGVQWYFGCVDVLATDNWTECIDDVLLSLAQFSLILATVILGAIVGLGVAYKYSYGK